MSTEAELRIEKAIAICDEMSPQSTDGTWLEDLTVEVGPYISEWDIDQCYRWADWPEREYRASGSTRRDLGIDVVAIGSDGRHIAIQCKARQLDQQGRGNSVSKEEINSFVADASGDLWAERWIVVNGDVSLGENAQEIESRTGKSIKLVNITDDLLQQRQSSAGDEECPHCAPNPDGEWRSRTRSCMQAEAIAESVRKLEDHAQSNSRGLPVGQARGKIILPCGTGKTRISLRIVEQLTPPGELSIVLCPSIALVAQIRREYLQHAQGRLRALAVCSDATAGYDPSREGSRDTASDPTLDNSNVSASVVKGKVTTDPAEIARWIRDGQKVGRLNVIFGTYQSGRPIADALQETGVTARVLVADEAHRTAGLRRKKSAKSTPLSPDEQRVRDFTLCHDNKAMPAAYRVYQTATPRTYNDAAKAKVDRNSDWIVRSMDDPETFGVDLYRKSYVEAVNNGWLADYRIIAVGINDPDAYAVANRLAQSTESTGRKGQNRLTTSHFLRGLAFALAMGGAAQSRDSGSIPIKSCIAFMNTVDKSKNMAKDLQQNDVKDWLRRWLSQYSNGRTAADYSLEHLDATSNVALRESAKHRLAAATESEPHGVINVGIFGEGVDSPSLSAVAFLEPRKSPIDVIQAVGRAMRTAPDKSMGYIICPSSSRRTPTPRRFSARAGRKRGGRSWDRYSWPCALTTSASRNNCPICFTCTCPGSPRRSAPSSALRDPRASASNAGFMRANRVRRKKRRRTLRGGRVPAQTISFRCGKPPEPIEKVLQEVRRPYNATSIITAKLNNDHSLELRTDSVVRDKPDDDGNPGPMDVRKTRVRIKALLNNNEGVVLPPLEEQEKRRKERERQANEHQLRMLKEMQEFGEAIRINLLEKSGLTGDRVLRDLNILEESVREAAYHLNADELRPALDRHFGLDNLKESDLNKQADGCTIAALLMMNAAMLHQRIANGRWLPGVSDLSAVKNDVNVVRRISREWNQITRHDFLPVLEPAVKVIEAVEDTGKLTGLERALSHIAAEAERIAETYADMGADHAGPLFNRVMGNQASDGAYFTRPVAASLAARLTLDACGDVDWTDLSVWKEHKTVDVACGSGTLLAAMLTDMKRRASERGASELQIAGLQKLAVEETIKGLDINPVSLQLAASQLTAGNHDIRYLRMGLHLMPYGPQPDGTGRVTAGSLELLGQRTIVAREGELDIADAKIASQTVWPSAPPADYSEMEEVVDSVRDPRIVIMNPPFTERVRMGEKFPKPIQESLRKRTDALEELLVKNDSELTKFVSRRAVRPLFVALAEKIVAEKSGILTMLNPTIMFSATSGQQERRVLAQRFHIHTVLTSHQPGQINLSQNTNINESIVVMRRHNGGPKPPTRFISLDRMPSREEDVANLHESLGRCIGEIIPNGWGVVCEWPTERMETGDWGPAIWRSQH